MGVIRPINVRTTTSVVLQSRTAARSMAKPARRRRISAFVAAAFGIGSKLLLGRDKRQRRRPDDPGQVYG